MGKIINLVGQRFGWLTVVEKAGLTRSRARIALWNCRCDCGKTSIVRSDHLRNGKTKSCGCQWKDLQRSTHGKHGATSCGQETSEYKSWTAMKERCCYEKHPAFAEYGGRGIKICDRWLHSFENFLEDMGTKPNGYTLDRIDNDGNYCKENCRWSSRKEQARNRKNNVHLDFDGVKHNLSEWAEILGIGYSTLKERIRRGWTTEKALTTSVDRK